MVAPSRSAFSEAGLKPRMSNEEPVRPLLVNQEGGPEGGGVESEEARGVFFRRPPYGPTEREKLEHDITHMPFRAWCAVCLAARAAAWPRFKVGEDDHERMLT